VSQRVNLFRVTKLHLSQIALFTDSKQWSTSHRAEIHKYMHV